jgi:hypothetical protein
MQCIQTICQLSQYLRVPFNPRMPNGHHQVFALKDSYILPTQCNMRRLTTGLRSEKCVVRQIRRCANVIECTYTNLDSTAYYKPSLYIAYCSLTTNLYSMLLY